VPVLVWYMLRMKSISYAVAGAPPSATSPDSADGDGRRNMRETCGRRPPLNGRRIATAPVWMRTKALPANSRQISIRPVVRLASV